MCGVWISVHNASSKASVVALNHCALSDIIIIFSSSMTTGIIIIGEYD